MLLVRARTRSTSRPTASTTGSTTARSRPTRSARCFARPACSRRVTKRVSDASCTAAAVPLVGAGGIRNGVTAARHGHAARPELDHRRAGSQGTRHPRRSRRRADDRRAGRGLRARPSRHCGHRRPAIRRKDGARAAHRVRRSRSRAASSCTSPRSTTATPPRRGAIGFCSCPPTSSTPLGDDEVYVHELPRHARRARVGRRRSASVADTYELPQGLTLDVDARRRARVLIPYDRIVTSVDRERRVHSHRSTRWTAR